MYQTPAMRALLLTAALAAASPVGARADEVAIEAAPPDGVSARAVAAVAGGAAVGFLAHETGHLLVNAAFGNQPTIEGMRLWGAVPFVVIAPHIDCRDDTRACTKGDGSPFGAGPRGKLAIVLAGYQVQHLTDELLLSLSPDLHTRSAPFRKGLLAFNVLTSVVYAAGAFTGLEDEHGDLANASRLSGRDSRVLATCLLVPALLDAYRYLHPEARWAAWASRVAKVGFGGVGIAF